MIKVKVTNNADTRRSYAGISVDSGETKEAVVAEHVADFLDASPLEVERVEEDEASAAAAELQDGVEERQSHLADAQAFALAQNVNGDVNEVKAGDDGRISQDDVAGHYDVDLSEDTADEEDGTATDESEKAKGHGEGSGVGGVGNAPRNILNRTNQTAPASQGEDRSKGTAVNTEAKTDDKG